MSELLLRELDILKQDVKRMRKNTVAVSGGIVIAANNNNQTADVQLPDGTIMYGVPVVGNYIPEADHPVHVLMNGTQPVVYPPTQTITSAAPGQASGVTVAAGIGSLIIRWAALTEADVKWNRGYYQVQVDTVNTFDSGDLKSVDSAGTSCVVTDLTPGTLHYIRVRGVDYVGQVGEWSATAQGTPGLVTEGDLGFTLDTGIEIVDELPSPPFAASDWGTVLGEYDFSDDSKITHDVNGLVSAVAPKSGGWGSIAQGTDANKPTTGTRTSPTGLNMLDFGGNDWLVLNVADENQPLTLVAVAEWDTWNNGYNHVMSNGIGGYQPTLYIYESQWQFYAGTPRNSTHGATTGELHIIIGVFNGTSSRLWIDGEEHSPGDPGSNALVQVLIGGDTTTAFWDGPIAHAIYYDGVVADPAGLSAALDVKWITGTPGGEYQQGDVVFLTTDNKLYRYTGTEWTAAVPTTDLTGTIGTLQIADDAITQIKIATDAIGTVEIQNDAITTDKINALAVTAAELGTGAVTDVKIATDAVTTDKIAALAVTVNELATNAVTEVKIADDAVTTAKINALAVTAAELGAGAVTETKIATDAVTTDKIAALAVTVAELAANAVTETKIATDAVTTPKIMAGAVTAAEIASHTITAAEIAALTITAAEIAAATITGGKIAADTITGNNIAANAINTDELNANAVTAAKIAANTITASQIAGHTITAAEIAALTITAAEIAAATITGGKIAADTITGNNIAASAISADELAANAVVAGKIAAGTIVAADISALTITGDKIAANTLTAAKIAANTLTAAEIAADAITASELAANAVTTDKLLAGAVTAAKIAAHTITANEIAANTLTAAEIAANAITTDELNANAVTAGKLAAISIEAGKYIRSTSYVAGTSGWTIEADGSAEFNNVMVRGRAELVGSGNLITNPDFETDTTGWIADPGEYTWKFNTTVESWTANNGTFQWVEDFWQPTGAAELINANGSMSIASSPSGASGIAVTPGTVVIGKAMTRGVPYSGTAGNKQVRVRINWWTAGGAANGTSDGDWFDSYANVWHAAVVKATAPASTAYMSISVMQNTTTQYDTIHIDNATLSVATNATISRDTSTYNSGVASLRIRSSAAGWTAASTPGTLHTGIACIPGEVYTLRYYFQQTNSIRPFFYPRFYDVSGNYKGATFRLDHFGPSGPSGWMLVTAVFQVPANLSSVTQMSLTFGFTATAATQDLYIDDVALRKASTLKGGAILSDVETPSQQFVGSVQPDQFGFPMFTLRGVLHAQSECCMVTRATTDHLSIASGNWIQVPFDQVIYSQGCLTADLTNDLIRVQRTGYYLVNAYILWVSWSVTSTGRYEVVVEHYDGAAGGLGNYIGVVCKDIWNDTGGTCGYPTNSATGIVRLDAGETIIMKAYNGATTTKYVEGGPGGQMPMADPSVLLQAVFLGDIA